MIKFLKRKFQNLISDERFSEILTGSAWALGARVISSGLGLLTTVIVVKWYGADVLGIVAVINSFLLLATIFTVLGTNTSILRLIPEHLAKYSATSAFKIYRKMQFMVIGVSLLTGTLFYLGANVIAEKIFNKPHLSFYFALAAVFIVFKSLMSLNTSAVRGLRLIKSFALMQTLPQGFNLLLLLLLTLLVSSMNVPVYSLLGGFALTGITGWIIMEYAFKKKNQPQDQYQPMPAKDIISLSLPMFMTSTITFIIGQTGVIMLGMFRSEADVGYYAVAVKLASLTSFILVAISSISAPKFSELYHAGDIEELFRIARKSSKLIFWTTAPILVLLMFFGSCIIKYLLGDDFLLSYLALILLVVGQFVNSISGSTIAFMNMTGHHRELRNIMLITATTNITTNLILIHNYGLIGAALSGMISLILSNIITLMYIKYKFKKTIAYFPLISI